MPSPATAGVRSAQAAQEAAHAQASAAAANVAAAEAAVHDAERQVVDTTLSAPSDGRVGNRAVEAGNRVQAGQVLLALVDPVVWVVANFKETQLARMVVGMPVELTVDALPGQTIHGQIRQSRPGQRRAIRPASARQRHRQFQQRWCSVCP